MRHAEQESELKQLGDYELLERCGRGANAVVYRARQRSLDRIVAVKVLLRTHEENDAVRRARFVREARLAAQLRHPNAVQVIEAGTQEGLAFVAMEWLEGHDLRDELALRAPLSLKTAACLARDIADALRAAHRRGIVHRDLKPANVMITRSYELARAVVIDFGLARSANPTADASLTCENTMLGTPSYMSPETIRGDHTQSASDIYALGIMLLEMLTGINPWRCASALETVSRHLHPEVRNQALELLHAHPPGLRALIASMLRPDPDHRPDASAVLRALTPWFGGATEHADDRTHSLLAAPSKLSGRGAFTDEAGDAAAPAAPDCRSTRSDTSAPGTTRVWQVALSAAALLICALALTLTALSSRPGAQPAPERTPSEAVSFPSPTVSRAKASESARSTPPTTHSPVVMRARWRWLSPESSLAHDVRTRSSVRRVDRADEPAAASSTRAPLAQNLQSSSSIADGEPDAGANPGPYEVDGREGNLSPQPPASAGSSGSLTVIVVAPGELVIDGVSYGERSALVLPRLSEGRHRVELRGEGWASSREVDIRPGRRHTLRMTSDRPAPSSPTDALTQNP